MNEKKKLRRAQRDARQEKEGKKVVNWIFGALIVLAIAYMIYMVVIV